MEGLRGKFQDMAEHAKICQDKYAAKGSDVARATGNRMCQKKANMEP